MALQDILNAIAKETDDRVQAAQTQQRAKLKELREESERRLLQKRRQIADQKELKMRQIRDKAESHARILQSQEIMRKKQDCMDGLYSEVLSALQNLPKDQLQRFLAGCIAQIDSKGTIYPASQHEEILKSILPPGYTLGTPITCDGGFRFSSNKEEHDFTFEFLISQVLRPTTDVTAALNLFAS